MLNMRLTSLLALLLALNGCALTDSTPGDMPRSAGALTHWELSGKLALRSPSGNTSARVLWQQSRDDSDIRLYGPFGAGSTRIEVRDEAATLTKGDDAWQADSAASLAREVLDLELPVDELRYWVRALPSPSLPVTERRNSSEGLLSYLEQAGWQLQFDRYRRENNTFLPGKITASQGQTRLTLVINRWKL